LTSALTSAPEGSRVPIRARRAVPAAKASGRYRFSKTASGWTALTQSINRLLARRAAVGRAAAQGAAGPVPFRSNHLLAGERTCRNAVSTSSAGTSSSFSRTPGSQWTLRWRELDSNFPYAGAMNLVFAPVVPSTTISSVKILTAWLEPSASSPARPLTAKCQRDDPKSGPGRSQTRVLAGLAWGGTHRPVRSKGPARAVSVRGNDPAGL
jgi:hypothetical protein